jgi:hypothetical protein
VPVGHKSQAGKRLKHAGLAISIQRGRQSLRSRRRAQHFGGAGSRTACLCGTAVLSCPLFGPHRGKRCAAQTSPSALTSSRAQRVAASQVHRHPPALCWRFRRPLHITPFSLRPRPPPRPLPQELVGRAIKGRRDQYTIATKCGIVFGCVRLGAPGSCPPCMAPLAAAADAYDPPFHAKSTSSQGRVWVVPAFWV